ncbi:hypothetical protein ACIQC9_06550 [Brevundimonas sp. NPDC092305]|uniref:hypothetical protein n=1 Tax=Brevundimonas sp. NPDC092305 TaxID=3363957 RepID=UPI0038045A91
MVGMLQILTYMFAFYLVVKALEFVQRAITAPKESRRSAGGLAVLVFIACLGAAVLSITAQDEQALGISTSASSYSPF